MKKMMDRFKLLDRVAIVTGGAGLLGMEHAEVLAEAGAVPVLWDIREKDLEQSASVIRQRFGGQCLGMNVDITNLSSVQAGLEQIIKQLGHPQILINNAARDPKVASHSDDTWTRLEHFSLDLWEGDIKVGLTGAFVCSQVIGSHMAQHGNGVILNIASDLGVIGPDQRIYQQPNRSPEQQPVKPVSYSVIKHGLIGLTKYLATYWADTGIRVNAISPGGVYQGQPDEFVTRLTDLIPMGRMAQRDEYKCAVLFLISDASSYMTGSNLIIDGGRSCW